MKNQPQQKIECLIIDDEFFAQEIITAYIEKIDWLKLIGVANNAIQGLEKIKKFKPQLIFLDISMPEITGIELLKALGNSEYKPNTIITSANSIHAFDAFELNVVDYLLKPISFDRFLKAVLKSQKLVELNILSNSEGENVLGGATASLSKINYSETTVSTSESLGKLWIKSDKKMFHIDLNKLSVVESLKDYVRFKNIDGTNIITYQTLQQIENLLSKQDFLRIHRSFIININEIKFIYGNMIVLNSGEEFPIGVSYRDIVMNKLNIIESRKSK